MSLVILKEANQTSELPQPIRALSEKVFALLREGQWPSLDRAIDLLIQETGRGRTINPFENPDLSPWNNVGMYFIGNKMYLEALTLFQAHLECYYRLQEQEPRERIHKGTPLQYLGITNRLMGQLDLSRKYHVLAFIEDVINSGSSDRNNVPRDNVLGSPASIVLRRTFRMRDLELISLQRFVLRELEANREIFYPEEIHLEWIIENEKETGILIARSKEESLYKVNLNYLQKLQKRALEDSTGRNLELLATYLFSCVDGFEPILRKTTKAFHFDVVVRNLVRDHPLLEKLGEYIGVECKNIRKTVNAEELNHFIQKLRLHNIRCGIIFTNKGVSGIKYKEARNYGKSIQVKTFNRDGIVIFDITKSDIQKISKGDNLLSLLLRKYEVIRFT